MCESSMTGCFSGPGSMEDDGRPANARRVSGGSRSAFGTMPPGIKAATEDGHVPLRMAILARRGRETDPECGEIQAPPSVNVISTDGCHRTDDACRSRWA